MMTLKTPSKLRVIQSPLYKKEELIGKQIIAVVNFPKKQIGNFMSEFLTTGFIGENGEVVLAIPERRVGNGSKLAYSDGI